MRALFDEINRVTSNKKSIRRLELTRIEDVSRLDSKFEEFSLSKSKKMWNSTLFILLLLLFIFVFLAKSFDLQLINGNENLVLAEGNRIRIIHSQAERGLILDREGEILVRNTPAFSLNMSTETCVSKEKCFQIVHDLTDVANIKTDLTRIEKDISDGKLSVVISTGLSKDDLLSIEPNLTEYPMFSIGVAPKREYIYGNAFSHLLGYVGIADTPQSEFEGKTGIEEYYDNYLKGISGGEVVQVNSSGYKIATISEKKTIPGGDLQLFVDKDLQIKAYELLKEKVEKKEAIAGAVIVSDPTNGGILALTNYPSFDPNAMSGGLSSNEFNSLLSEPNFPFFNRSISATYPPASTFKMIISAAALMENVITPEYKIIDKGYIQIGSYIFRNWNTSGHGEVDMRRAIQVSNDTYFYTVGGGYENILGLGIDKISEWSKRFGLGSVSGIDLHGEVPGFVPDSKYKDWYLGDTYISSIGQGDFLSTPLQINNVTSYYANNGIVYIPRISQTSEQKVLFEDIIDSKTMEVVKDGLHMAVLPGGTGYPLFDFSQRHAGVTVYGKTGTAEYGGNNSENTHAWFTAFANSDKSNIAVTVFLEGGGSGADDTAPIAKELLDLWYNKNN